MNSDAGTLSGWGSMLQAPVAPTEPPVEPEKETDEVELDVQQLQARQLEGQLEMLRTRRCFGTTPPSLRWKSL